MWICTNPHRNTAEESESEVRRSPKWEPVMGMLPSWRLDVPTRCNSHANLPCTVLTWMAGCFRTFHSSQHVCMWICTNPLWPGSDLNRLDLTNSELELTWTDMTWPDLSWLYHIFSLYDLLSDLTWTNLTDYVLTWHKCVTQLHNIFLSLTWNSPPTARLPKIFSSTCLWPVYIFCRKRLLISAFTLVPLESLHKYIGYLLHTRSALPSVVKFQNRYRSVKQLDIYEITFFNNIFQV